MGWRIWRPNRFGLQFNIGRFAGHIHMNTIWPIEHNKLTTEQTEKLHQSLRSPFKNRLQQFAIDEGLGDYLASFYIPFASWLGEKQSTVSRTLVVGINGAQGSGKSTLSQLTADILTQGFGLNTVVLSIDDIYKTRQQREQMAIDIHPLFKTRGVPGTHDTALGMSLIQQISTLKAGQSLPIPHFDKGNDDRSPKNLWPRCTGPVDILIVEGWCVGTQPQTTDELTHATNPLEKNEDEKLIWRRTVNEHLKTDYKEFFGLLDCLIFLQIPNVDCVLKWRGLQEQKLAEKHQHERHLMSTQKSLKRFIAHYERLTLSQLKNMPDISDLTITLDNHHQIKRALIRRP